jgi:CRISPR-associated protein Cmr6
MPGIQKSSRRQPLAPLYLNSIPPKDTRDQSTILLAIEKGVHAGLWLDKYISSLEREEKESQARLVKEVASIPVPEVYKTFYKRWEQNLQSDKHAIKREFGAKGRVAIGLGNENVLETSISLHRTYGVPYIPGSALKGLAASYARLMAGDAWSPAIKDGAYSVVFGDTDNAGYVTFFDAFYIPNSTPNNQPLRVDVITVHHPNYYQGKKDASPADWDSPTPIPFLSATGSYLIALAAPDLDNAELWFDKVFDLLEEALLALGIGAKTSSGYGRMKRERGSAELEVLTKDDENELQEIDIHLEKIQKMLDNQVTSQMRNIGNKWLILKSPIARRKLAWAILEKVRQSGKEKEVKDQFWYQRLLEYVK